MLYRIKKQCTSQSISAFQLIWDFWLTTYVCDLMYMRLLLGLWHQSQPPGVHQWLYFYLFWPKSHRQPHNEDGSQGPGKGISWIRTMNLPILSEQAMISLRHSPKRVEWKIFSFIVWFPVFKYSRLAKLTMVVCTTTVCFLLRLFNWQLNCIGIILFSESALLQKCS